jgi:AbrB family looped-hinge helix DNA binding protein
MTVCLLEVQMISTVRVQEKGQVTIPRTIRRQLNLKKGDLVTFISTEYGVVVKTLDLAADDLLITLGKSLQAREIKIVDVIARSQKVGADVLTREFNLLPEERNMLFQSLQLKAQAAVEAIRTAEDSVTSAKLTDDDIEAEIQETREKS